MDHPHYFAGTVTGAGAAFLIPVRVAPVTGFVPSGGPAIGASIASSADHCSGVSVPAGAATRLAVSEQR